VPTVLAARSYASACVLVLLTYSVKRAVLPGITVCWLTNATSGPAPAPGAPGRGELFVTSIEFALIVVRTSVAVAWLAGFVADVAVFCTWYGPPVAEAGSVTFKMTWYTAPGASGPTSGVRLPFESVSGVTPSLWNSCTIEPAGNVLPPVLMSNTSFPVPVFVSVFVNDTTEPCWALGKVWPVNVTDADWFTVNGATFVNSGPTLPEPSK